MLCCPKEEKVVQKKIVKNEHRRRGIARQRVHWAEAGSEYLPKPRQRGWCWGRQRHLVKSCKDTMSFKNAISFFRLASFSSPGCG